MGFSKYVENFIPFIPALIRNLFQQNARVNWIDSEKIFKIDEIHPPIRFIRIYLESNLSMIVSCVITSLLERGR